VELKELGSMNVRALRRGQNHTDVLQDAFYSVSFNNSHSKKDGRWERKIQAKIAQRELKVKRSARLRKRLQNSYGLCLSTPGLLEHLHLLP